MRRNRPDVNAAPSRPKFRQPIKPYPGQNVLTNHSVQQPFRRRNRFERYLHTCVVAVTSTRKPCFAAGCRENRRHRLCGGQPCNISVFLETRSTRWAHSDQSHCTPNPQDKRGSPILARSLAEDFRCEQGMGARLCHQKKD